MTCFLGVFLCNSCEHPSPPQLDNLSKYVPKPVAWAALEPLSVLLHLPMTTYTDVCNLCASARGVPTTQNTRLCMYEHMHACMQGRMDACMCRYRWESSRKSRLRRMGSASSEWFREAPNGPRKPRIGPNGPRKPRLAQNGPRKFRSGQNGPRKHKLAQNGFRIDQNDPSKPRIIQGSPEWPREAQIGPEWPQEAQIGPEWSQGAQIGCQELPGAPRSGQELPGAARCCQELSGAFWLFGLLEFFGFF